ncbi:hypothetical protein [Streptomyces montanisoli]|uniref:Uncharacterized protein n=1 Tax=Streptomyces montanisoli TaxID=2798581 RepID=A0A940M5T2_9ACTN|nr:hypothetical protein [Streptomyces montanisoli]MBP0456675.1 hypothetical protein [Streptomyces montanisoli]
MERAVDLDEAAAAVFQRQPDWQNAGLVVAPVTWRDGAAPWPQQLETDRSRVSDPDSIGVHVSGTCDAELLVVLYRGGWADVEYIVSIEDAGVLLVRAVSSAKAFGELLDTCMSRVFGPRGPVPVVGERGRNEFTSGPSSFGLLL